MWKTTIPRKIPESRQIKKTASMKKKHPIIRKESIMEQTSQQTKIPHTNQASNNSPASPYLSGPPAYTPKPDTVYTKQLKAHFSFFGF